MRKVGTEDPSALLPDTGLSEADAEALLREAEYGVLSLADGGETYAIPTSYGVSDDLGAVYFLFAFGPESRKRGFIETTATATLVVAAVDLPDAWESVLVSGPLEPAPEADTERGYAALADNAAFPALYTFGDGDGGPVTQSLYRLDVESVSGRAAGGPDASA